MTDALFDAAIAKVLTHEGGLVDDPADAGGVTNFGISQRSYPNEDIRHLTREAAVEIYRRDWWDRYEYAQLPATVAIKTMDLSVNMGAHRAHILLQEALTALAHPVSCDGVLGPATFAAASACGQDQLLAELRAQATDYYKLLAASRPQDAKFLHGWLNRVND